MPHLLQGYSLFARDDASFTDSVLKLCRGELGIHPHLTPAQFLSRGFVERKLIAVAGIMQACGRMHATAAADAARGKTVPPYSR